MMIVIDASAIVKLALEEPSSKETRSTIKAFLSDGEIIASPSVAIAEVLNALWKHNVLIKDLKDSSLTVAIQEIMEFWDNVEKIPVETLVHGAINIAKRHKLTVYDSFYVAASISNKAPLLTFDNQIIDNHEELSVELAKLIHHF